MSKQMIDEAQLALEAARQARAETYAQPEFEQAESLLKSAVKRFEVGNVLKARVFAEKSKAMAEQARHLALEKQRRPIPPLDTSAEGKGNAPGI
jgi:hypothetical protein